MLAQFQSLYPTGSLISELVEIYNGKYIVRSSVQIEGVTRATGMAAAETVEEAEDKSRIRALMVLITKEEPQTEVQQKAIAQKEVSASPKPNLQLLANHSAVPSVEAPEYANTSAMAPTQIAPITPPSSPTQAPQAISSNPDVFSTDDYSEIYDQDLDKPLPIPTYNEPEFDTPIKDRDIMSDDELEAEENPTPSNVTPINQNTETDSIKKTSKTSTTKKRKKTEPVDLSDVIAKTDVELERLGWTPQQGREYLIDTYGKRGRTLLTEEELLDFLNHLESQPMQTDLSETDPLAGF
ncbi:hypothetical protein [Rivularia sp. UHCC 0363]|uniref:hypothetical protein n=1 Tax=Rivularia sp. UHCC 0363 TaxID=3110244 RepID=UPI002B213D7A|nr:hypothetical protein [Rivularia sp. UHCC 0363]MEA5596385.1 hypothetical protein [Rivularia sp. UHCC 0363]